MKDKIDPYLQPLYDALQDMIPAAKLKGIYGTEHHSDRSARFYARTYTQ